MSISPHLSRFAIPKWPRRVRLTATGLVVLFVGLFLLDWHASAPFVAAQRFHQHLKTEQFGDALEMIEPADRDKIPDGYWDQFRGHPPDYVISPTLLTLINRRMGMKPAYLNNEHEIPIEVRFEVDGSRLRVAEVTIFSADQQRH